MRDAMLFALQQSPTVRRIAAELVGERKSLCTVNLIGCCHARSQRFECGSDACLDTTIAYYHRLATRGEVPADAEPVRTPFDE